jgi:ATP-dependent Clp protease protease subunit
MRDEFESFASREMGIDESTIERYKRQQKYRNIIPSVFGEAEKEKSEFNIFSRLISDRIIYLGEDIDDDMANTIIAQLLYLNTVDRRTPINMYINSCGGVVTAGLGIYDMMQHISAPVYTTCTAQAASMASVLLSSGEKGFRSAMPHSSIMVHEMWGGFRGKYHDMLGNTEHAKQLHGDICTILSNNTGRSFTEIEEALRSDNWMRAKDAIEFGLIDKIL